MVSREAGAVPVAADSESAAVPDGAVVEFAIDPDAESVGRAESACGAAAVAAVSLVSWAAVDGDVESAMTSTFALSLPHAATPTVATTTANT